MQDVIRKKGLGKKRQGPGFRGAKNILHPQFYELRLEFLFGILCASNRNGILFN